MASLSLSYVLFIRSSCLQNNNQEYKLKKKSNGILSRLCGRGILVYNCKQNLNNIIPWREIAIESSISLLDGKCPQASKNFFMSS